MKYGPPISKKKEREEENIEKEKRNLCLCEEIPALSISRPVSLMLWLKLPGMSMTICMLCLSSQKYIILVCLEILSTCVLK